MGRGKKGGGKGTSLTLCLFLSFLPSFFLSFFKNTKIIPIVHEQTLGVGDALREMDRNGLLKGDFVLLQGDVVSNVDVGKVLFEHSNRRLTGAKNAIMTMVLKPGTPKALRGITDVNESHVDDVLVALEPRSGRLLYYNSNQNKSSNEDSSLQESVQISSDVFSHTAEVQLRNDLIDCRIDICSLEVLALFTEEFDYQDLRQDFVRNIVTPDDNGSVYGYEVFTHIIDHEYARRVGSIPEYYAVSRDILHRWAYPMTLDNNLLLAFECPEPPAPTLFTPGSREWATENLGRVTDTLQASRTSYRLQRDMIYKERDVVVSRLADIGDETSIGAHSMVGDRAVVNATIVGRRCKIGRGATLNSCYLWDNVDIGEGCVVQPGAILCSGVRLLPNVTVGTGAIVSFNTQIGPDVSIEPFTRITSIDTDTMRSIERDTLSDGDIADGGFGIGEDTTENGHSVPMDLGESGFGFRWIPARNSDDSDSDGEWGGISTGSEIDRGSSSGITSKRNAGGGKGGGSGTDKLSSTPGSAPGSASLGNRDERKFMHECREILVGSLREGHSDIETKLELKGRQLAYDMQEVEVCCLLFVVCCLFVVFCFRFEGSLFVQRFPDFPNTPKTHNNKTKKVAVTILRSFLSYALAQAQKGGKEATVDGNAVVAEAKKLFASHAGLLNAFKEDKDDPELVWIVLEHCVSPANAPLNTVFPYLLHAMYDADILEEEGLFAWQKECADQEMSADEQLLVDSCAQFFDWLRQSDSESESSSEEESSD
jgi:NDP-sugar pyrophosphorylase family protein